MMKKLKVISLFSLITILIIYVISFGISSFYDISFSKISFYIEILVIVIGLYLSLQGRRIGNRFLLPGNEHDLLNASLEVEREIQGIKYQDSTESGNKNINFSIKSIVMIISGIVSLLISYCLNKY